eukprot:6156088-Amphidinium_carterae.1
MGFGKLAASYSTQRQRQQRYTSHSGRAQEDPRVTPESLVALRSNNFCRAISARDLMLPYQDLVSRSGKVPPCGGMGFENLPAKRRSGYPDTQGPNQLNQNGDGFICELINLATLANWADQLRTRFAALTGCATQLAKCTTWL